MPLVAYRRHRREDATSELSGALSDRMRAVRRAAVPAGVVESVAVLAVVAVDLVLPGHARVDDAAVGALLISTALLTGFIAVGLRRGVDRPSGTALFIGWTLTDCGAIAAGVALSGGSRSEFYLVFLPLIVFQSGAGFPRRLRIALNATVVVSYLAALAVTGWHIDAATLVLRLGVLGAVAAGASMLSNQVLAELTRQVASSLDSQRRAQLWRRVADLGGNLAVLEPGAVWDWVLDAVQTLGYTSASIATVDHDRGEYHIVRAVGLPEAFTGGTHPWSVGMVGAVLGQGGTVVLDYASFASGHPSVRAMGMRTTIGVPIRAGSTVPAVLVAGVTVLRPPSDEELAALGLVAVYAAHGLTSAYQLDRERQIAEQVRALLDGAPDAMVVCGADHRIVRANHQAARLFRCPAEALVGRSLTDLFDADGGQRIEAAVRCVRGEGLPSCRPGIPADVRDPSEPLVGRVVTIPATADEPPLRARRTTGTEFLAEVTLAEARTPAGPLCTATVRDVTDRVAFEQQLEYLATHDDLTGLPNRPYFVRHLTTLLEGTVTDRSTLALCFLDVDHFKYVNDSRGHAVGDMLVAQIAERLRAAASHTDMVARFGGDEFAMVSTAVAGRRDALTWAWRWLGLLEQPFVLDGVECSVSASAGVTFGQHGDRALDLLQRADAAMYLAKRRGRARAELYDEALTANAAWRLDVTSALHSAIPRSELFLVYQPVVDLRTETVVGFEALLRWQRASGLVSPADFIPVAEDCGMIVPIGRWVLTKACRQLVEWLAPVGDHPAGSPTEPLTIGVNVSSRQLDHDRIIGDVTDAIAASGIRPDHLMLEITESAFIDDMPAAVRRIDALRRMGVRVAIDDFGTGFSSLSSLSRLPVDVVKIDKAFVDGLGTRYDTVVRAVVDVASGFGLAVVAEGVERRSQTERLTQLGCQLGQGFWFSPPLPAALAADVVTRRRCPTSR